MLGFGRLLILADAIERSFDHNVDDIAGKLADLRIFVPDRNGALRAGQGPVIENDFICSFCYDEYHSVSLCDKKPHRDSKFYEISMWPMSG